MVLSVPGPSRQYKINIQAVADSILTLQQSNGEIPWSIGDKTDPWDHVEAAMGLAIGGHYAAARKAYQWLLENQLSDGSWYSSYQDGKPLDKTRDTNMTTYIAVGLYQYYLITKDLTFLEKTWPVVEKAIEFALNLQSPSGKIQWAISPEGIIDPMALLTGSSSVFMSLKCALEISHIVGKSRPHWRMAAFNLSHAIIEKPNLFNISKSRFSMDWFYPILSGAVTGIRAEKRIQRYWSKFVVRDFGVRCVSDEPWVTLAETAELILALTAMGKTGLARILFSWICDKQFDDGSFFCGFTFPEVTVWPEEKISWTNAVILMAADALYGITPASDLFSHQFWIQKGITNHYAP
ncbi:phenyltransferase domain-containing protein [Desulfobacterales bacterium HSG17]|nr:phenyltransferase domain-containing protein [Desulfobacterales bacterium HSG17]